MATRSGRRRRYDWPLTISWPAGSSRWAYRICSTKQNSFRSFTGLYFKKWPTFMRDSKYVRIFKGVKRKTSWFVQCRAFWLIPTEILSRIRHFCLGYWYRIQGWQDPGSGWASKKLSIFSPKNCYQVLKNKIRDVHSDSGSWIYNFFHPGSREG